MARSTCFTSLVLAANCRQMIFIVGDARSRPRVPIVTAHVANRRQMRRRLATAPIDSLPTAHLCVGVLRL
jgi:hypothetical protein